MTEEEYRASVQKSKEDAHDETMWGKPARDIVTGIGNNGGIRPVRAIWELVQKRVRGQVPDQMKIELMSEALGNSHTVEQIKEDLFGLDFSKDNNRCMDKMRRDVLSHMK